ncbi:uncharacterized protein LOC105801161 [Gossypium raimondii]|uniref:uncharacterized protein LOC105801161 n=1 Tax=Gossypium raimondii TaxID=29730 RepID=UPI00063A86E0|nr:uncharacterized protein LOC105801161 [Gossypium raimondii]
MEGESSFSVAAPPVFDGDNYQMWAVRMETYLEALNLWEAVEEDYEVLPLLANPTVAQIKAQKEKKTRESKAKVYLFAAVSQMIFTRIMSLKLAKEIWDYLKVEYAGDERIHGMKVLNLVRDFELQKMKKSESVRLLGSELNDSRIVEKLLVTVPEKFEATITTLENTNDLSKIFLAELLNALQAQEQRRSMRQEGVIEDRESSESWLIDSGCTNHMTYDNELFKELRNTEVKRVRIGNGEYLKVKGKGTVAITSYEDTKFISDVLDANGRDLFNVEMKGKIFALNPMENEQMAFKSRVSDTETWHKRLGHFHHRGLLQMQSKKLRTPSLNGNLYYIAFIDDLTRMCWIFLLKQKSEVAGVFWKFKAKVENESGCMIQILRSDNGKEYTSETFNRFC